MTTAVRAVDLHPGGEQLHRYWVLGEGRAKWHSWRELLAHLIKFMPPRKAKRTASAWFHDRYGYWPGDKRNRSNHGRASYGDVAFTGNAWMNERAQRVLNRGLRQLPPRPPSARRLARLHARRFDPGQPRNPHTGEWIHIGGDIHVPDLGGVFDLNHLGKYEDLYQVSDESKDIAGFVAISMKNGEAQVAFDTDTHRYVLTDTDAAGLRDIADTFESLLDEYENRFDPEDGTEYQAGELVDWLHTADGEITIGFDQAGDFRVTATDTGNKIDFPELNPDQVQELIDGLREQADNAEQNEE